MPFQSAIFLQQGFGVCGEIFDNGPIRAQSFQLVSDDESYNVFGRCFTITDQGVAAAGGTGPFAGFLVSPKQNVLQGDTTGTLAPSLTLPNYAQAEILSMGSIIVALPAAADIGDLVVYDNITGALSTIAPGANLPVGKTFAKAIVDRFNVSDAGLAVITVSPSQKIPVLA